MNEQPQKDLVIEARELLEKRHHAIEHSVRLVMCQLCDEVERLRGFAREFAFEEGDDFEGRVDAMRTFHGKDSR